MITFNVSQLERLAEEMGNKPKALVKELYIAVGAAANYGKSQVAKELAKELATKQKVIKDTISVQKKIHAHGGNFAAKIIIKKSKRISLREFNPTQNKSGVSYRVSKREGRKHVAGAFRGPRPGLVNVKTNGNVFRRKGEERLPIIKLKGPSPLGVYYGREIGPLVLKRIEDELEKQVEKRIRFNVLKREGKLNWSQFP
jgi:hypothetical protein